MKILSIETSCDDTGISILEATGAKKPVFRVLANSLNSQIKIHAPYGGVFPALAKREHLKNLPILLEKTLKKLKINAKNLNNEIDLIAVTYGPGLEPALWTGIVFAKEISLSCSSTGKAKKCLPVGRQGKIPIMPVNHMEGHIFSVFVKNKIKFSIPKIKFPAISLLISGGHTELVLMENFGKYKIIGETLDDAAGEAFDKVARMLELPYPGGPEISKLAENARRETLHLRSLGRSDGDGQRKFSAENFCAEKVQGFSLISLPRPMLHSKNFNFSFSGLKTAVLYLIRDLKKENSDILQNDKIKKQIAMEFENAVVETLIYKTKKAIEKYNVKTLIVAGGVSANKYLKKEIKKSINKKIKIFFPDKKLTGDNAIMIGIAGYLKFIKNKNKTSKIKADGGLRL